MTCDERVPYLSASCVGCAHQRIHNLHQKISQINGQELPDILFWPSLGGPAGGANEYPCMAQFNVVFWTMSLEVATEVI